MPSQSKAQFRLFEAVKHNPDFAKKTGISPKVAEEFTSSQEHSGAYNKLPERKKKSRKELLYG